LFFGLFCFFGLFRRQPAWIWTPSPLCWRNLVAPSNLRPVHHVSQSHENPSSFQTHFYEAMGSIHILSDYRITTGAGFGAGRQAHGESQGRAESRIRQN
jgi:hypothetical protein